MDDLKWNMDESLTISDAFTYLESKGFNDIAPKYEDGRLSTALLQSTVLLEDAKNFRSIYHKHDKTALIVYRFYYSKFVQILLSVNIAVVLLLAFFETPSSISFTSDITMPADQLARFQFPCTVLETIDLTCLILFAVDALVKSYLIGRKQILRSPWLMVYYLVVTVSISDCVFSLSAGCQAPFRVRRYLRPFYLIQSSSLMKKAIKALRKTIPEIISVLVLLFIHLYFFTIVGMLIYPRYYRVDDPEPRPDNATIITGGSLVYDSSLDSYTVQQLSSIHNARNQSHSQHQHHYEQNKFFPNLRGTIVNLIILLTTANNPDAMEQSYSRNRFSSIYFVLYLLIGTYCIMSLITAVIYNKFKGFFRGSMVSSAFRQSLGVRASFWVLHSKFNVPDQPGYLAKTAVQCLVENLSVSQGRKRRLLRNLREISYPIQLDPDVASYVELEQYEKLFLDNFNGLDEELEASEDQDSDDQTIQQRLSQAELQATYFGKYKFRLRRLLARLFHTKAYIICNCLLTLLNIGCISAEVEVLKNPYHTIDEIHRNLSYAILAFAGFYTCENSLKLWSYGWRHYRRNRLDVADGLISLLFLVLQLVHYAQYGHPYIVHSEAFYYLTDTRFSVWAASRLLNVCLIFRLINLAPSIRVMYNLISTTVDIVRKLRPLFGLMLFIYYDAALLGMQLFSSTIRSDSFDHLNTTSPDDYCGSYKQLSYWAHNFDDFYSALIVLWNIMVVNNWHVLMQAFVDTSSEWARLYFVAWWLLSVIVMLNMCVSLILDLYVLKCEADQKVVSRGRSDQTTTKQISSLHSLFNDIPRADENKMQKALVRHPFIDFESMIVNLDYTTELSTVVDGAVIHVTIN